MRTALCALMLCFGLQGWSQSNTVMEFQEKADGYNIYLYQSLLRTVLNHERIPEFNKLIRDLDHIRILFTDSLSDEGPKLYQSLNQGLLSEGFESFMEFDSKDSKITLYELEGDGRKSQWVATVRFLGRTGLMEMKGNLDMKYLSVLGELDPSTLDSMLESQFGQ